MTSESINVGTRAGQEELRRRGVKPIPLPDDLTRPYWDAARQKRLVVQHCTACGQYQHPPQATCKACDGSALEWKPVSGKGVVYSFIIDHRLLVPGFNEPYAVAQVVPDEAQQDTVRLTSNVLECDASDVYIGMPVEVTFQDVKPDVVLPQFKPAAGAKLRSRGEQPPT